MPNNLWDNTRQWDRIRYRMAPYSKLAWHMMRQGVSLSRIISARFPYAFPDNKYPASLSLELTDACDLKCLYCNNPLFAYPRKFMNEEVFNALINALKNFPVDRIRVGGGEPTLNNHFIRFSEQLGKTVKFLSIVTNAQWKKERIPEILLTHYNLIEISVDAGGKEQYEQSRKGAKYSLLMENMDKLNRLKKQMKAGAHINLRFMVRPSNDKDIYGEFAFLKKYCDTIMPQYIVRHAESDYKEDVYYSVHVKNDAYPKCTLPFKDLQLKANGDIPLCQVSGSTTIPGKKKIIGNIKNNTLQQIWQGDALKCLRKAHRRREYKNMHPCKGCKGC